MIYVYGIYAVLAVALLAAYISQENWPDDY